MYILDIRVYILDIRVYILDARVYILDALIDGRIERSEGFHMTSTVLSVGEFLVAPVTPQMIIMMLCRITYMCYHMTSEIMRVLRFIVTKRASMHHFYNHKFHLHIETDNILNDYRAMRRTENHYIIMIMIAM